MHDRANSGLLPLLLCALILVISAVAVILGGDDAQSAGTQDGHPSPSQAAVPR
jgi:hypothetical protein